MDHSRRMRQAPLLLLAATFAAGSAGASPCALDTTFDGDGRAQITVPGFRVAAQSVAVLPDGRYLVAGGGETVAAPFDFTAFVLRLTRDGRLDAGYGSGGVRTWTAPAGLALSASSRATGMAVAPDGSAYVLVDLELQGGGHGHRVLRFTPAGAFDASYGNAGVADPGCSQNVAGGIAVDASGRVFVSSGLQGSAMTLSRLTAGGQQDTTFGTAGCRSYASLSGQTYLAPRASGYELVSAASSQVLTLRVSANGVPDPTYGGGDGTVTATGPGGLNGVIGIGLQGDRVLGLSLTSVPSEFLVLRLDGDGEFDGTFGDGTGVRVVPISPGNDFSLAVAATPDRIAIAGVAEATSPNTRVGFAWLDGNGQPAPECDAGQTYEAALGPQAGSDGRAIAMDGTSIVIVGVASATAALRDQVGVIALDPGLLLRDGFEE